MKKRKKFKTGTVVVFDPSNFSEEYWNDLSESKRLEYYGPLGYGREKPKHFIFVAEIRQIEGHCVLTDMETGKTEVMRHTSDFRRVKKSEL